MKFIKVTEKHGAPRTMVLHEDDLKNVIKIFNKTCRSANPSFKLSIDGSSETYFICNLNVKTNSRNLSQKICIYPDFSWGLFDGREVIPSDLYNFAWRLWLGCVS